MISGMGTSVEPAYSPDRQYNWDVPVVMNITVSGSSRSRVSE